MSHLTDRHHDRLQRAQRLTGERAVEALWVEPSVGLAYLTGLDLVGLERPTGLVIPAEGALRMVVPLLLRDECEAVGAEMEVWDDAGGPTGAIRAALEGISRLHVQGSLPASHLFALKSAVPDLEDVNAMAMPVLAHRVVLNFQAEAEGITPEKVIVVEKRP
jgi:Xaa-Pro aminopeptidase